VARAADGAHAMCDVSDQIVADLGHIREGSGVSAVMEATALPLSLPVRCIVAQGSNLVPRLAVPPTSTSWLRVASGRDAGI
jgi:thiamine monophosphate kinase